jgi:AraC-like DNA-binding protein
LTLEVRTLAATYYDGHHIEPHQHPWGQLIYASEGVMRVHVDDRLWLVPPQRALWAPPRTRHEIWAQGTFAMRTLYLSERLCALLPPVCEAIDVSPLLRELVLSIVRAGMLDGAKPTDRRAIAFLVDQLASPQVLPLTLLMPRDKRARLVADRLREHPSDPTELAELARYAGASTRTLQRVFRAETGLRFAEWRRRLRLLHAAALISTGVSVTAAGLEVGYQSTSAFIAAFRTELGLTPARMRPIQPTTAAGAGPRRIPR